MEKETYKFNGTQGNWYIEDEQENELKLRSDLNEDVCILEHFGDEFRSQQLSNAYLISASPDLLNACIYLIENLRKRKGTSEQGKIAPAEAFKINTAIRRALNLTD